MAREHNWETFTNYIDRSWRKGYAKNHPGPLNPSKSIPKENLPNEPETAEIPLSEGSDRFRYIYVCPVPIMITTMDGVWVSNAALYETRILASIYFKGV